MAPDDQAISFGRLGVAAFQYFPQDVLIQRHREPDDIHGQERRAPHGVNVAQRVGRRDLPELEGVIGYGREKIDRHNQRDVVVQAVDGRVVPRLRPDQQIGVTDHWNMLQDLNQVLQAELRGSTGAVGELGQAEFLTHHLASS